MSIAIKARRLLVSMTFSVLNPLIRAPFFLRLFNYVYERLSVRFVNVAVAHVRNPAVVATWKILLLNGKTIKTLIDPADIKTWQFALSYKWQDPALNIVENILDQYYPKDAPWIDAGANLGLRSLTALSSGRPVYFAEPNNELNSINRQRCELNDFKNYNFIPLGLSDTDGELTFYIDRSSYLSSFDKNAVAESDILRVEKIPVTKLDSVFDKPGYGFTSACIKIDTEGHEAKVIAGGMKFIAKYRPAMVIEINEKGAHITSILNTLSSLDYHAYAIIYRPDYKVLVPHRPESSNDEFFTSNNFLFACGNELNRRLAEYVD